MAPLELPLPGSYSTSSTSLVTQRRLHPSVETTGFRNSRSDEKPVIDLKNLGLTAKVVAGNEKVLETPSGLRLPCDAAAVENIKADAHIDIILSKPSNRHHRDCRESIPARTNAQFPPLPVYGPSKWFRWVEIQFFRGISLVLSTIFLLTIVCGAVFKTLQLSIRILPRSLSQAPERPLRDLEHQLNREIDEQERKYGNAKLKCDVGYYARRVGLDIEEFKVTTEDGFILILQHIFDPDYRTEGRNGTKRKYPVLLMHGLLQSSGAFCSNDDSSLAFYLCKSGYDVWLGNNRCYYKPEHMVLKSSDPRMWCWNIRQMGIFDLPAFVDYILFRTGFAKLALVAHSQGTTQSFVAMAKDQHPTLGSKISIFCALAPAVYSGPLINMAHFKFMKLIPAGMFRTVFGIHSFIPFMITMHTIVPGRLYGWLGYRVFTYLFDWSDALWSQRQRSRGFMFSPVYVSSESMRWWLGRDGFATHRCVLATKNEVEEEERIGGYLTATAEDQDGQKHHMESKAVATTRPVVVKGKEKIEATARLTTKTEALEQCICSSPTRSEFAEERQKRVISIDALTHVENNSAVHGNILDRGGGHGEKGESRCECSIGCFSGTMSERSRTQREHTPQEVSTERQEKAWFDGTFPPLALWICGADKLVDGMKLLHRLDRGAEPYVDLVHSKIIPAYEHLDCIWAIDSIKQVGSEVKSCIWDSLHKDFRKNMNLEVPTGCESADA
ncbi:hypothetical protein TWF730_007856 [Orbilia blumenaviensis]|uniref:Partial AB-hydrolase lipase domain-containing protein n=1 Tax=Orbilia blumenaviensis TaxID=1796055 RepID=A0AAV9VBN2_9PEZI